MLLPGAQRLEMKTLTEHRRRMPIESGRERRMNLIAMKHPLKLSKKIHLLVEMRTSPKI
jgi:hypothetical protein